MAFSSTIIRVAMVLCCMLVVLAEAQSTGKPGGRRAEWRAKYEACLNAPTFDADKPADCKTLQAQAKAKYEDQKANKEKWAEERQKLVEEWKKAREEGRAPQFSDEQKKAWADFKKFSIECCGFGRRGRGGKTTVAPGRR